MVYRDVFINELNTDFRRCMILFVIGFVVLCVVAYYFGRACYRSYACYKKYVVAVSSTTPGGGGLLTLELGDPSFDDIPAAPPTPSQEGDDIPGSVAFAAAMSKRAKDPNVAAFNRHVDELCKGKKQCTVDPGLGGGTAAAFDPSQDDYASTDDDDSSSETTDDDDD